MVTWSPCRRVDESPSRIARRFAGVSTSRTTARSSQGAAATNRAAVSVPGSSPTRARMPCCPKVRWALVRTRPRRASMTTPDPEPLDPARCTTDGLTLAIRSAWLSFWSAGSGLAVRLAARSPSGRLVVVAAAGAAWPPALPAVPGPTSCALTTPVRAATATTRAASRYLVFMTRLLSAGRSSVTVVGSCGGVSGPWPRSTDGHPTAAVYRSRQSGAQVGEDGQDPAVVGGGGGEAELAEDAGDVLLDRALGDDQALGDGGVAAALGHEGEDVQLAGAEGGQGVGAAAAAQQLGDHLGGDGAAAAPADGGQELGHVGHPVLEQVADALGAAGEEVGGVALLHVLGQDQDGGGGGALAHLHGRPQALVGVAGGHAHVDHGQVGPVGVDGRDQAGAVPDLGHDLDPAVGQQPGQALAQQDGVLGDHDSHGSSALITVGPPGGLEMVRWPSTAATRSARPCRPLPLAGSAPPTPSSMTSTMSRSRWRAMRTPISAARACLAALARASATTK